MVVDCGDVWLHGADRRRGDTRVAAVPVSAVWEWGVLAGLFLAVLRLVRLVWLYRLWPGALGPPPAVVVREVSRAFEGSVAAALSMSCVHRPERECIACGKCTDCPEADGCRCGWDGAEQW